MYATLINITYCVLTKSSLKLLRSQSRIPLNAIWGPSVVSQIRYLYTRTQLPIGHFLSNTSIGTFHRRQTQSKQHPSQIHTDSLPPLSAEQKLAVDRLITGSGNVIINACAGSGKTTTIHQIAAAAPNKTFLALMFNRRIMEETISRAKGLGIKNIIVYTYHSFGCEFYSSECFTDQGLKRVLKDDMQPQKALPRFDDVILDEQQDMNPILYGFLCKVVRDAKKDGGPQINMLSLGDPHQEIYSHNNADYRFLTMAKDLFQDLCGVRADWTEIRHRTSYRMSKQIAKFINHQLLRSPKEEEILTARNDESPRPRYLICDSSSDDPLNEVLRLISLGLLPSQIIVLAHSLRIKRHGKRPLQHLANKLALFHPSIPVHISTDDDTEISPRVTQGKLVFATYHQAKGIEREAAIVFDFDMSYYIHSQENQIKPRSADNPQYVAATRARTHLIVIHDYKHEYLPFIDRKTLHESCEVVQLQRLDITPRKEKPKKQTYKYVTTLTRNQSERVVSDCFAMLKPRQIGEPSLRAGPATEIEVREDVWECVADITGTAIPAIYESQTLNSQPDLEARQATPKGYSSFSRIFKSLQSNSKQHPVLGLLPPEYIQKLRRLEQGARTGILDIAEILYLANVSNAMDSGYIVKVLSIPFEKYTWFELAHVRRVYYNLRKHIPTRVSYEKEISGIFQDVMAEGCPVHLHGRTDFSTYNRVFEVKWVKMLRPEHVLQLALYAAISMAKLPDAWNEANQYRNRYLLINVSTGQVVTLEPTLDNLKEVLRRLVKSEKNTLRLLDDVRFREAAARGFDDFIGPVTIPAWLSHVSKKKPVS